MSIAKTLIQKEIARYRRGIVLGEEDKDTAKSRIGKKHGVLLTITKKEADETVNRIDEYLKRAFKSIKELETDLKKL